MICIECTYIKCWYFSFTERWRNLSNNTTLIYIKKIINLIIVNLLQHTKSQWSISYCNNFQICLICVYTIWRKSNKSNYNVCNKWDSSLLVNISCINNQRHIIIHNRYWKESFFRRPNRIWITITIRCDRLITYYKYYTTQHMNTSP